MPAFLDIPNSSRLFLRNASVPACLIEGRPAGTAVDDDGIAHIDIVAADGFIEALHPAGQNATPADIDLSESMVWPCFADVHTHIDKGHIWPRKQNPDGTRPGALSSTGADRAENWTADDVRARMEFSLRCAYAHGTAAIRTHLDSTAPQHKISWPVFAGLRDAWKDRITLQGVCLEPIWGYADRAFGTEIADMMVEYGGILGAVLNIQDDTDNLLDFVIGLALDRELELDFHVDEMGDPDAKSFDKICEALIRNGYNRPVNVGHCCSLSIRPQDEVNRALDLAAEANLRVTSLPMCNLFLQGRQFEANGNDRRSQTPRWRGVTILHELKARGIPVAIASDNTRDPFYAYGDLDAVEVFSQAVKIAQLDYPFGDWPMAITRTPAETMGLSDVGRLKAGGPADIVIFRARSYSELIPRPQFDRIVLRSGKAIDTTPPDYRELDDILARQPA